MVRTGAALAALLLGGCQAEPPATIAPDPAWTVARPIPEAAPPEHADRGPGLCAVLADIVARERNGFAELRATPLAASTWLGRATVPGTERCTIEGDTWPGARYVCAGLPVTRDGRERAQADYEVLAREIDRCLASPTWFPHDWQRGSGFEFAMGERLQTWTDLSTTPPSQLVLKVQQDALGQSYQVKLNLEAVP